VARKIPTCKRGFGKFKYAVKKSNGVGKQILEKSNMR
jgi:hypothetical protein